MTRFARCGAAARSTVVCVASALFALGCAAHEPASTPQLEQSGEDQNPAAVVAGGAGVASTSSSGTHAGAAAARGAAPNPSAAPASDPNGSPASDPSSGTAVLRAMIDRQGGELIGAADGPFRDLRLTIPPDALKEPTQIEVRIPEQSAKLPATAVRCGQPFELLPRGLTLAVPARLTLPFDAAAVDDQYRFADEVRIWESSGDHVEQRLAIDNTDRTVDVEVQALSQFAAGVVPPDPVKLVRFSLEANPKFAACLAGHPGDRFRAPSVQVVVVRGNQADGLFLRAHNLKANLAMTMFTVERGELRADGSEDPQFKNFGLASYQTDVDADRRGDARAAIRTILLDQAFVFDADTQLAPTSAFELGLWFNDPADAAPCGFDVNKPTPFNDAHEAGPNAMISLPDRASGLGPLCTNADTSVEPPRCIIAD